MSVGQFLFSTIFKISTLHLHSESSARPAAVISPFWLPMTEPHHTVACSHRNFDATRHPQSELWDRGRISVDQMACRRPGLVGWRLALWWCGLPWWTSTMWRSSLVQWPPGYGYSFALRTVKPCLRSRRITTPPPPRWNIPIAPLF